MKNERGLRYNDGKTKHHLLPAWALEQVAKVFTVGAIKYEEHNWMKGMPWSEVIASLKRHLNKFERGYDFDDEMMENYNEKIYHIAEVAVNALFLLEYYRVKPEFDNRQHEYLNHKRIGLDVDDVLADFTSAWKDYYNLNELPHNWYFDRTINQKFEEMKKNGVLDDFYMKLKPKVDPKDLKFEPYCYITSRPVDKEVTERWLDMNGFSAGKVYSIGIEQSKVEVAKSASIDIFVDDKLQNFIELNNAGICTFLFDAPHNRKYNVGYKRIHSLNELITA
jgi:uncharacterized HAD superfamily protein